MTDYLLPLSYALFAWWFSTGAILYLNNLPPTTYRWSMFGATVVLLACLLGLAASSADATAMGAFLAFTQALLVWGWLEMSYFMGFVTGPRKRPCPPDCTGWRRFNLALKTSLHHELAIVGFGVALVALTWEAPNQVGTWTFVTLWVMRWSAKLNLFFGVPNINEEWLPEHLRFLKSYTRQRPMNLLFPLSVSAASVIATVLVLRAAAATEDFERTGFALVTTILALAILEHWFLVLPIKDSALWNWALAAAGKEPCPADQGSREADQAGRQAAAQNREAPGAPGVRDHGEPPVRALPKVETVNLLSVR